MRTSVFAAVLFLCGSVAAQAQSLSFGVKAGIPFTDAVEGSFGVHSEAPPYTAGPTLELSLPASLAVEVDALYRRSGYSATDSDSGLTNFGRIRVNSVEFPLLLKHYLPGPLMQPYLSGGYVGRRVFSTSGGAHLVGTTAAGIPIDTTFRPADSVLLHDNPVHGIAVGGGLRLRMGPFAIAPEIRYTRWTGRTFDDVGPRGFFLRSVQNQVDILLGLSFRPGL